MDLAAIVHSASQPFLFPLEEYIPVGGFGAYVEDGIFSGIYYILRLKKIQKLGAEELRVLQEKKLRKIVDHAYANVPFGNTSVKDGTYGGKGQSEC